ncbi:hypothetical protein [Glycomyces albidus]|jgi:hypothetical protein|uniref:Uncharacterized protein n=1 Tax=Glycomyces albidus TaxID=2656774 RepID=A0A6L5G7A8_9ACTN|nr:hypothetical protein [Glycomyces albidus]MQM25532.1 hypothetical protein [Glycomyces albidus]
MNRIEFALVPAKAADVPTLSEDGQSLAIAVDGTPLIDLARRAELDDARADGQPQLAGGYANLLYLDRICWPSRHFLDQPALVWFGDGDTVVAGCTCGDYGCWPLCVQIEVTHEHVVWRDFRNGHRTNWDLSALGPFVFDRTEYEAALRRATPARETASS